MLLGLPALGADEAAIPKAPGDLPIIGFQPIGRTVTEGGHATLSVSLSQGTPPVFYQWWRNGQALSNDARLTGAAGPVLNIDPAQLSDSGTYLAVVTNSFGAVTSAPVSLVASQLVFNFTPVGGTGAWMNIAGQIGDVYRIEVNTNFTGYRIAGYATNTTGQTRYFDYDPGTGFRQVRVRFNHMLPVLSPEEGAVATKPSMPGAIRAYGKLNQVWRFEGSSNLFQWSHVQTVTNTNGWIRLIDPAVASGAPPIQFSRIVPP